jgi:hypothetical protein
LLVRLTFEPVVGASESGFLGIRGGAVRDGVDAKITGDRNHIA